MAATRKSKIMLEDVLIEVWRQALVENLSTATLAGKKYPVRQTPKAKLREVEFQFDGRTLVGIEQNPKTRSRWAKLARSGKKVMQFIENGRYVAAVVDGKAVLYGSDTSSSDKKTSGLVTLN